MPGRGAGGGGPGPDDVVDDDPLLRSRVAHMFCDRAGVGARDREHRGCEVPCSIPARATDSSAAASSALTAAGAPTASWLLGAGAPEVQLAGLQVEHGRERLGRPAVDPEHVAGVLPGAVGREGGRKLDEGNTLHARILPGSGGG